MEKKMGPTPNGGDCALTYYYDENGLEVDKDKAVGGIVTEFDSNNNVIKETSFLLKLNNL